MFKKKNFDSKTAKKIINEYAEKINLLTRENETLKKQLEDAETSLKINKELLYKKITPNTNKEDKQDNQQFDLEKELKNENQRLTEKISWLFSEKMEYSKKLYTLQQELDDKNQKIYDLIEKQKNDKFVFDNQIIEKDNKILSLKTQVDKLITNKCLKDVFLYVGDPNKFNTEMNSELETARTLIKKYSYFLHKEKVLTSNQASQIRELEEQIKKLKQGKGNSFHKKNCKSECNIILENNINSINNEEIKNQILEDDFEFNELLEDFLNDDYNDIDKNDISIMDIYYCQTQVNNNNKVVPKLKIDDKSVPKLNFANVLRKYSEPPKLQIVDKPKSNAQNVENLKKQILSYKNFLLRFRDKMIQLQKINEQLKEKNSMLLNNKEDAMSMGPNCNTGSVISEQETDEHHFEQYDEPSSKDKKEIKEKNLDNIEIKD